ncbi:MAG: NADH-quinone oxidoreductase subunit L [Thauera sp.]|nr:NADH-quinone oxidoreductase subunit L [Thauera sp.]
MTPNLLIAIPLLPLVAALIAGLAGRRIGRAASAGVTILAVGISCALSLYVAKLIFLDGVPASDITVYTWLVSDGIRFQVGFLVDRLTALMMVVVNFVSFCVHVYTIGYMRDDDGFQRFFSYISLFTFSMLMLVMANNFMQLFFGWEAVGLVSYLLIGFWFTRPSAIHANLKAFIVNRIGDFAFVLGIAGVVYWTHSLDYADLFALAPSLETATFALSAGTTVPALTLIALCLFVGAMAKSAQVPLHVWLPDSMEGPTPISALIHAATMVTAGIFMVARMSPLFELSDTALSFVLVIGATTALFMGFLGIVQNDIKRVVAYSTLSQLGYMTVALGVSAYSAAVFHLMTHAFFKALLFLGAGSVIIGMHHDQDMRNMGGLRKYMPITWITSLLGSLALIGFPFFSGFYSKDSIIEAVHSSTIAGSGYAMFCVLLGVFITAFYSFRMYFLVFHGEERFGKAHDHAHHDHHGDHDDEEPSADHHHGLAPGQKPHESPWVVTLPLVLLAVPSVLIGFFTIDPMLFGEWFKGVILVGDNHVGLRELAANYHGPVGMAIHGLQTAPFWLAMGGVALAWFFYMKRPDIPAAIQRTFKPIHTLLENKYYFDRFNEIFFAAGARLLGRGLWKAGDQALIDGVAVNGSARLVGWVAQMSRLFQTGHLYQYAFMMIIGVFVLLTYWFNRG